MTTKSEWGSVDDSIKLSSLFTINVCMNMNDVEIRNLIIIFKV